MAPLPPLPATPQGRPLPPNPSTPRRARESAPSPSPEIFIGPRAAQPYAYTSQSRRDRDEAILVEVRRQEELKKRAEEDAKAREQQRLDYKRIQEQRCREKEELRIREEKLAEQIRQQQEEPQRQEEAYTRRREKMAAQRAANRQRHRDEANARWREGAEARYRKAVLEKEKEAKRRRDSEAREHAREEERQRQQRAREDRSDHRKFTSRARRDAEPQPQSQTWKTYDAGWAKASRLGNIPWPVGSGRIGEVAGDPVRTFYLRSFTKQEELVEILKNERKRWHPDRVLRKVGELKDEVKDKVTEVFQIVDDLLARETNRGERSTGLVDL